MSEAMATEVLGKIRACLEIGLVLGTDRFREQDISLKRWAYRGVGRPFALLCPSAPTPISVNWIGYTAR